MRDALAEGRCDAEEGGGGLSLFRKWEPPKVAVCFASPAMTRYAVDWLRKLGGCRPLAILSDDFDDVVWNCEAERADLLVLEMDFSNGVEDKDISACCDVAIEIKRRLPECRVYLICEDGYPKKQAALDKAVELNLIDGYCIGDLSAQQMRTWLDEATESMRAAESRDTAFRKEE